MEPGGIATKILTFQENRNTQGLWMKYVQQNLEKCGLREKDVENREVSETKTAAIKDISKGI